MYKNRRRKRENFSLIQGDQSGIPFYSLGKQFAFDVLIMLHGLCLLFCFFSLCLVLAVDENTVFRVSVSVYVYVCMLCVCQRRRGKKRRSENAGPMLPLSHTESNS